MPTKKRSINKSKRKMIIANLICVIVFKNIFKKTHTKSANVKFSDYTRGEVKSVQKKKPKTEL